MYKRNRIVKHSAQKIQTILHYLLYQPFTLSSVRKETWKCLYVQQELKKPNRLNQKNCNIAHIVTKRKMSTTPIFTGFVDIFYLSNCQRWDPTAFFQNHNYNCVISSPLQCKIYKRFSLMLLYSSSRKNPIEYLLNFGNFFKHIRGIFLHQKNSPTFRSFELPVKESYEFLL